MIEEFIETRFIAGTGIELDRNALYEIGKASIEFGSSKGTAFAGGPASWWIGKSIRSISKESLPSQFADIEPARYEYLLRGDPRISWKWNDDEISRMTRDALQPVLRFYSRLTRIKVLMQIPGREIKPHRDISIGNLYDRMDEPHSGNLGPNGWMRYRGPKWLHDIYPIPDTDYHRNQDYLALKVPLDMDSSCTRSYLIQSGDLNRPLENRKIIRYSPLGQPYWLNEYEVLHGVDAGDQWRGVIFLDGILNMDAVRKSKLIKFPSI